MDRVAAVVVFALRELRVALAKDGSTSESPTSRGTEVAINGGFYCRTSSSPSALATCFCRENCVKLGGGHQLTRCAHLGLREQLYAAGNGRFHRP